MKYIREKVGTKACRVGRIVKSRVKWTRSIFELIDPENIDVDTKINFLYRPTVRRDMDIGNSHDGHSENRFHSPHQRRSQDLGGGHPADATR